LPWLNSGESGSAPASDIDMPLELVLENGLVPLDEPGLAAKIEGGLPETGLPEAEARTASAPDFPFSWAELLLAVWLGGAVLCFLSMARATWRFQRLLRFAHEAGPGLQEHVRALAGRLGLASPPRLWLVPGEISPMLWALASRPRLLFPAALIERLAPAQLDALLLHELAHWRRRDHWVRFAEAAVSVLYWWHPAVWWARHALHEAEEQCCDAWVLTVLEGTKDAERIYALALLETVALLSHTRLKLPATASGIGQVPQLRRRLTMIMSGRIPQSLSRAGSFALAGFALGLLPLVPVRAQDNDPTRGPDSKGVRYRAVQVQPIQIQVRPAEGQKQGSLDEQIEALRRVLQMLEQQKQGKAQRRLRDPDRAAADLQMLEQQKQGKAPPAMPGGLRRSAPAANPEEIGRAKAEVKSLPISLRPSATIWRKRKGRFSKHRANLRSYRASPLT
jgi:beta-lactamase regulating signal transducer with metallopeptidase domain